MPIPRWKAALNHTAIMFDDRIIRLHNYVDTLIADTRFFTV
jgi:hypothetical protein